MPSKKHLENKNRRRRSAVQLNDFLRGDYEQFQNISQSGNQSPVPSNKSQNVNTSSVGSIPSNGLPESDVTPIMTPTPETHSSVNFWHPTAEIDQPDSNYSVDTEEFPDLGKRLKRAKQATPPLANSDNDEIILSPNSRRRFRGRRGRLVDPPVLGNFLPEPVRPTVVDNRQQTVAKWLDSVRPADSQQTGNDQSNSSSPNKVILLRKEEQQEEKVAGQPSQKQQKTPDNIVQKQQTTPVNSLQQQKSPCNLLQQQQMSLSNAAQQPQQNGLANAAQQSHQKGIVNTAQPQQQKSLSNSAQQQQQHKSPANEAQQQQQKSPANEAQQHQQKSPANAAQTQQQKSLANAARKHQQQKNPANTAKPQQQNSLANAAQQLQQKSPANAAQPQQQNSLANAAQQLQQKSPANAAQQQEQNNVANAAQQQQQKNLANAAQQQQQKSSVNAAQPHLQKSLAIAAQQQQQQKILAITAQQQQQNSPVNDAQQQQKSLAKPLQEQQKSPGNSFQQQQKSPGNEFQQQQKKSPGQLIQQQQKGIVSPLKQQPLRRPGNPSQQHQQPKSPALGVNVSSIPIHAFEGQRSQRPTPHSPPRGHQGGGDEDDDMVPPTPISQSQKSMWRFPRRFDNQRVARSLQSTSQDFMHSQSSTEGSPQEGVVPRQVQRCVQQQQLSRNQVKRLLEQQPSRQIRQLAMRSELNSDAQEFRPREQRAPGGSNQAWQPEHGFHGGSKMSRRRRRQRFLRSLNQNNLQSLPSQSPVYRQENTHGLLPTPFVRPGDYYSAPAVAQGHYTPAAAPPPQPAANPPPVISTLTNTPPETIQVHFGSNPPPMICYNPQSGQIWSNPPSQIPIDIRSSNASQSVFRLASLPCTGVGTPNTDMLTDWSRPSQPNSPSRLPSSISGPSQLSHTLSSPPMEDQQQQESPDEDLLYSRPLLDMDQEDTQLEQQDQEWGWGSPLQNLQPLVVDDPDGGENADVARDTVPPLERHKIFRAPSEHGQDYPKPDLNCVPSSIKKLHHLISSQYSDYAFVYALSAQLCQECVPMDCYVYLKMVLLASIVSIEPDELRAPISLCIIATDSLMANRLMNKVGQLAPRFLGPHDYGLHPTFSALPTRFNWIVACPLLMAQQGVYYAGDWTRLSKEQSCQLEKCIENGAVPVPQLQIEQHLEAAVWTHWQPENSTNQTVALAKLCPIFGLPIYMGDQVSDSLWNFIIQRHSAEGQNMSHDGLNIAEDDMRMLIHLLHRRKTTFNDKAQYMLQKYYVISRKERPTVFSSKTYIVLKQFAESFAKLALRLEVLESDVCVAIFHCEHFVQRIFGTKEQLAPPAVISFSVISRIDPYMNEFARWLLQYLDRYEDEELGMQMAKRRRTDSWGSP
ncbi:uncharacterized protein LOC108045264 isoform X1 [Drosophila rhopaloa]|uniref:Uncharacterized protein LOC108045264 isoform X1 n=1 Tax=Drosophila rhopaloa TaxID=1041015 RepID=A0A6P4F3W1_DRORH|nr:uncharacterized protein LOC108045264 isoform X1 [Drosophila rhopaloa]